MRTDIAVTDNPDRQRYEARLGEDVIGYAQYQLAGDLMVLTHTEVDPAYEGRGVGAALARTALEDVRERDLQALPICPFITSWVSRNPEYSDVLYSAPRSHVTD